jgi:large subunit ribosomal protein L4
LEKEKPVTSEPIFHALMDVKNNQVSRINLDPKVFDVPLKEHLLHELVIMQSASHRRGTASSKTRGQVSGGGAKPWRQKGTGRARAGSNTSPLWVGGGVTFGPRPRDYSYRVPRKVRKAALRMALSQKRREGKLLILDELKLAQIKTRELREIISDMDLKDVLIVIPDRDDNIELSARNLPDVKVLRAQGLNVRDIILYDQLVITRSALLRLEEELG